jgi:hypothetical protein
MVPYRASETVLEIQPFRSPQQVGWQVDNCRVAAWWGPGETGKIEMQGLAEDCRMALVVGETGEARTVVCR